MYKSRYKKGNSIDDNCSSTSVNLPRSSIFNHSKEKQTRRFPSKNKYISFCTDEASLQIQIETLITNIQSCSIKFCQQDEEYRNTKNELDCQKRKFDKTTPDLLTEIQRLQTKARNIQRDIKCEQWSTNTSNAQNDNLKSSLEDWRRVKLKYNRHMVRISDSVHKSKYHVERMNKKSANSREQQSNLQGLYKKNQFESVNMRQAVMNETDVQFRKAHTNLPEKPTLGNFLTTYENYEKDRTELLKYRLHRDTNKNTVKSVAIQNYVGRTQELDQCFAEIKRVEGISDLSEIEHSLVRMSEQKFKVYDQLYNISNLTQKYKQENELMEKHIRDTKNYMTKFTQEEVDYEKNKENANKFLETQHIELLPPVKEIESEQEIVRDNCHRNFNFWINKKIADYVPLPNEIEHKQFVEMGIFDMLKLITWYDQIVNKLHDVYEIKMDFSSSNIYKKSQNDLMRTKPGTKENSYCCGTESDIARDATLSSQEYNVADLGYNYKRFKKGTSIVDSYQVNNRSVKARAYKLTDSEAIAQIDNFKVNIEDYDETGRNVYIDSGDNIKYAGEKKMLDFKTIRNKNYTGILSKTNDKIRARTGKKSFRITRDILNHSQEFIANNSMQQSFELL